jgi:hypothetical protein
VTEPTPEQLRWLEDAETRVRAAQVAYAPFLGRELRPGLSNQPINATEMARCQAELEAAERDLQLLRQQLLG